VIEIIVIIKTVVACVIRWVNVNQFTFMKNRLEIARDLLSEDGVIFVQCDDNEQAYLKVLMDEVFERDNFVANFIWKKKGTSTNVKGVQVSQLCELIVCYTATKATAIYSRIIKSENRTYSHKDELGKYRLVIIEKKNTGEYRRESMRFKIIGKEPRTGKRWQIGEIKAKKLETAGRFILDNEIVKQKIYDFEDADSFSAQPTLLDNIGSTNEGDREITKLSFGGKFNNPKPEKLLQRIIHIATKKGPPPSNATLSNNSPSFLTVVPMTFCILLTAISSI
jgi:adenine-specific DNA-methyltransferase